MERRTKYVALGENGTTFSFSDRFEYDRQRKEFTVRLDLEYRACAQRRPGHAKSPVQPLVAPAPKLTSIPALVVKSQETALQKASIRFSSALKIAACILVTLAATYFVHQHWRRTSPHLTQSRPPQHREIGPRLPLAPSPKDPGTPKATILSEGTSLSWRTPNWNSIPGVLVCHYRSLHSRNKASTFGLDPNLQMADELTHGSQAPEEALATCSPTRCQTSYGPANVLGGWSSTRGATGRDTPVCPGPQAPACTGLRLGFIPISYGFDRRGPVDVTFAPSFLQVAGFPEVTASSSGKRPCRNLRCSIIPAPATTGSNIVGRHLNWSV